MVKKEIINGKVFIEQTIYYVYNSEDDVNNDNPHLITTDVEEFQQHKNNSKYLFDINDKDLYEYDKPELAERTKKRLTEMAELGMEEVGVAQFGIRDIHSGLYVEMVWSYSDTDFNDYMYWVKELKELNN